MALLDDLVSQVPDLSLRSRLQQAVAETRRRQRFGLVFEDHIPETTALLGLPIQPGVTVQRRQDSADPQSFRVARLTRKGHTAVLLAQDGSETEEAVKNLLVVKRFGEPMYASLRPLDRITRTSEDKPHHAVINGENFHALQLFTYMFAGCVDCIYIDPPYNTGARDWKYNNRIVDSNDGWRHSKWLAMMSRRLRLAKRLLKPDGVLVVMIDEHELHHLGMLLERLFPGHLRYVVSIVINARGSTGNRNFGSIEEQALFVVPNLGYDIIQPREAIVPDFHTETDETLPIGRLLRKIAQVSPSLVDDFQAAGIELDDEEREHWAQATNGRPLEEAEVDVEDGDLPEPEDIPDEDNPAVYWRGAVRTGQGTSFRVQRPNQFYPLYVDPSNLERIEVGTPLLGRDKSGNLLPPSWNRVKGLTPIWPIDEEGAARVWCYAPERMRLEIQKENIRIGRFNPKRNTYAVNVRRVRRTTRRFRERTIWWEKSYDAGSNGTNILKRLLGSSGLFDFPKSIYAVRDVLATVVGSRPDALILDFFAGSGTTLHSTALLNTIDGGRRRCILVTNNEVAEGIAASLEKDGLYRGDKAFEAMGIYERVTAPRVRAAVTGKQPNGTRLSGTYKWAGNRPLAAGFDENVEFYGLQYLDPDDVELGEQFKAIHPLLWMAAGGTGKRDDSIAPQDFYVAPASPYAILFKPSRLRKLLDALRRRPDITHVWIVTDSEEAYAEACEALPASVTHTSQLYGDYLRNFRVNERRI